MNRALVFARFARQNAAVSTVLRNQRRNLSGDGHYIGYRELNYESSRRSHKYAVEVLAGIFWWWIGWNMMTDWKHLVGEFIWPEKAKWTDEELGIPPEE